MSGTTRPSAPRLPNAPGRINLATPASGALSFLTSAARAADDLNVDNRGRSAPYNKILTYDIPPLVKGETEDAQSALFYKLLGYVVTRDIQGLRQVRAQQKDVLMRLIALEKPKTLKKENVEKESQINPVDVLCKTCCCCCSCLCSASSTGPTEPEGFTLRGFRRLEKDNTSTLIEEQFDPNGHTLLGVAIRMHHYDVAFFLLELAAASRDCDDKAFVNQMDKRRNTAAFYASKLYNWTSESDDPSNKFLKLLVTDCGAEFIIQESAHFILTNDVLFFAAGVVVILGYVICINWEKIMQATLGKVTTVNTSCDTMYGISLKPIFLTFLDAATMRILQYFTANPRYKWMCGPAEQAIGLLSGGAKVPENLDTMTEMVHNKLGDVTLPNVSSPGSEGSASASASASTTKSFSLEQAGSALESKVAEVADKDGGEVFDDLREKHNKYEDNRNKARPSIADDYDPETAEHRLSGRSLLPNAIVDVSDSKTRDAERKKRDEALKSYITDASSYDDTTGRMGKSIKTNAKFIFVYVQCAKFVFSVIFSMAKAKKGSTSLRNYVNYYGLIMNADLPTVIFSLLAPIHMNLEVLRELDDNKGAMGLLVLVWHVILYFWHRFCDIFSTKKFGYWALFMIFPFVMIIPPLFTHFFVACILYCWLGFICLFFALVAWRLKGIFFCILRCFERCFDVWFLLYVAIEIVARFVFVAYCQTLYNVVSVIYLQDNITDPGNYMYALTWTWHLTMNPQCFAANKDVSMLLVYLSSF